MVLAGVVLLERCPVHGKVAGLFPGQDTHQVGVHVEAGQSMFSLPTPLPLYKQ